MMRKLLILSVLSLLTAGTTGCFHNCCGPSMGGLFARCPQQQQQMQCCQPVQCCPQPCCDPCGGAMTTTTMSPVMSAPCCP
jgi:hypothetical protein